MFRIILVQAEMTNPALLLPSGAETIGSWAAPDYDIGVEQIDPNQCSRRKLNAMPTPDELYDEAIRLKDQGNLDEAATKLLAIIAEAPTHSLSHSALAVVMQKLGKFDEAIAHAKKVVELEPNDPFSFAQLSVICQRCGRIAEAEDALARNQTMSAQRRH